MEKINIHSFAEQNNASIFKNKFALVGSVRNMRNIPKENRELLMEGFIIVFVTSGEIQATINDNTVLISKGEILLCSPRNILERGMFNMDFDAIGFFFTPEYAEELARTLNFEWTQRIITVDHDSIQATEEEMSILTDYYRLIHRAINSADSPSKEKMLDSLINSMAYYIIDIGKNSGKLMNNSAHSSQENIFLRFVKMLTPEEGRTHVHYLSVNEYADKLNITAKYFSSICKRLTGKTASQIINEEIIKSAQIMLRDNRYSIKQVSINLGFANQSHFGTYFHKHVGMSPQEFRRSNA